MRLFSFTVGLGAGVLLGGYVVLRVDRAARAAHPVRLADRAGRAAGGLTARLRTAAAAGLAEAAEREEELRRALDVGEVRDALT